eukprot:scaffold132711_cov22-Tisochrysis_lutea.AAC.1
MEQEGMLWRVALGSERPVKQDGVLHFDACQELVRSREACLGMHCAYECQKFQSWVDNLRLEPAKEVEDLRQEGSFAFGGTQ